MQSLDEFCSAWAVVEVMAFVSAVRVVQQGKQLRNARIDAKLQRKRPSVEGHACPMAGTVDAVPIQAETFPDASDEPGWQQPHRFAHARRTACAE
jgi:hypothetical protein